MSAAPVAQDSVAQTRTRRNYLAVSLLVAALVTMASIVLSYHFERGNRIDVGSVYSPSYVAGFFSDEADLTYRYRWTTSHAVVTFAGIGGAQPQRVIVQAQGFRPSSFAQPVTMTVSANGTILEPAVVTLTRQLATYSFTPPRGALFISPPLVVSIDAPTFRPAGDGRDLGVKVARVALDQTDTGLNLPPLDMLIWPAVFVVSLYYFLTLLPGVLGRVLPPALCLFAVAIMLAFRLQANVFLPPFAQLSGLAAFLCWQWRRMSEWPEWVDRLGRMSLARPFMLGGMALYAGLLLWTLPQVDWIGHADYAENAVIARNVVQGRGLTVDYVAQFYDPHPTLTHPAETWPLLQPALIAPFFALFGPQTWVAKLPNLLFMLGLAWAVFSLASRLWDPRVGLLAGLLTLAHPYFFNSVLYPVNDLPFTAIFFVLVWLVWHTILPNQDAPPVGQAEKTLRMQPLRNLVRNRPAWLMQAPAIGALSGLLVWSKPSGAFLLMSLLLWAGWVWWRRYRPAGVRVPWRVLLPALGTFVLVLLPLLLHNMLAFGKPFFSTEGYDAWILRYWPVHEWEDIYKVYTGTEPPNFRWVLGGKFGYDNLFKAVGVNLEWVWKRGVLGEQGSSDFVFGLLPLSITLVGLASATRRVAGLFGMVALCVGLYSLFVLGYWHYEGRYFQVVVPWLYMLLAWGLFWVWDRLRERLRDGLGRRWSLLLLPVGIAAVLLPMRDTIEAQIKADIQPTGFVADMAWLKAHTEPGDVIMTRDPWELNWYSERKAVMIPNDDLATIERVAQQYGATYLQLGGPVDGINTRDCPSTPAPGSAYPTGIRPQFGSMYCGVEKPGYKLVYRAGGLTIYRIAVK